MKKFLIRGAMLLKANAPLLLSIGAAAGVAVLSYLLIKETSKAETVLDVIEEEEASFTEKAKAVLPIYIPSIVVFLVTIGSILGSEMIGAHRIRDLTAASSAAAGYFASYRNQVKKDYGEEADQKVFEEICVPIEAEEDEELFLMDHCPWFFSGEKEKVIQAFLSANKHLAMYGSVSVHDLLNFAETDLDHINPPLDQLSWTEESLYDEFHYVFLPCSFEKVNNGELEYWHISVPQPIITVS